MVNWWLSGKHKLREVIKMFDLLDEWCLILKGEHATACACTCSCNCAMGSSSWKHDNDDTAKDGAEDAWGMY
jgi:hypothetical protein